jgi:hypothetical protein
MHETLGQKEVRRFRDDCLKGKFGKMDFTHAGKFEHDPQAWIESINP